jgi:hypothetical protein
VVASGEVRRLVSWGEHGSSLLYRVNITPDHSVPGKDAPSSTLTVVLRPLRMPPTGRASLMRIQEEVTTMEFGAKGIVVSSDLGQSANITHPDGLEVAIGAMKREGISDADIDLMVRKNPAMLLGLSN